MNGLIRQERVDIIQKEKLVLIIRVEHPESILAIIDYLIEAGVKAVEVTSNTPDYQEYLPQIKVRYPNLLLGAGTITDVATAKQAISAGAEFLVTPNTESSIVEYAHQHQVPVMMGALTPTDIVNAKQIGADFIKLFPAEPLGPQYLAALAKGPFQDLAFFPVGGINENNTKAYINAGAKGVGVGGNLAVPVKSEAHRVELIARLKKLIEQLK